MRVTRAVVAEQRQWCLDRSGTVVPLINDTREALASHFGAEVERVTESGYRRTLTDTFADGDRAVNAAALVALLRELDVAGDYPGFVVDELLGRELAGIVAGDQPLRLLAEATFHFADIHAPEHADDGAGVDDVDAALAAGVQTRRPGWSWREDPSPFGVTPEE